MKGFIVALVLGLAAAGGAFVLDTNLPDRVPDQAYLSPFTTANGTSTFLVLHQDGAPRIPIETCDGPLTPTHAFSILTLAPGCHAHVDDLAWHVGTGEPVGNATRLQITWYIFDEQARLVASNAPDAQRFQDHPDQQIVDASGLYLGTGRAPPGYEPLPIAAPDLEAAIGDAHVGGVVSVYVDDHPHVGYLGPVYVTLRIDGIA